MSTQYTPQTVAELLDGRLVGDPDVTLTGLSEIGSASPGDLTFVGEAGYAPRWAESKASAAIVTEGIELEPGEGRALVFVKSADLAMAKILEAMAPPAVRPGPGIHATAVVDGGAEIASDAVIGPHCFVGPGAYVGPGTVLQAHVTVMDEARIGADCVLWPNVVVRERCIIGDRCVLEPGCVIGADGFGYRPEKTGDRVRIVKVPHLGHVELGDEVELGAHVTIDRGKFAATTIGAGTKIDNQTQIGHNCRIGRLVMMSGCCGVAGSVTIGDGALIGGGVMFRDHLTIGRGVKIAAAAVVANDIPDGEDWLGYNAGPVKQVLREIMAVKKLPQLLKDFKKLKGQVEREAEK